MNNVKTGILLIALTIILIWFGSIFGGARGATIAFIFALVINFVSYWYSDKIVLSIYKAQEIPEGRFYHLYNLVRELTQNAELPMPRIYMIENPSPNAFATGRDPQHAALCVTKGLLELLNENELKGVLAHELAHVKNRDTLIMTVTAAIAGAIMMLASMARWAAILGGGYGRQRRDSNNVISLIAVSILAPIAALIVQLAISRSREYAADKHGAYFAKDSSGLAMALIKLKKATVLKPMEASPQTAHLFIVNPFRASFITTLFSTHPPIEERVRQLQSIKF
ncbi:MAG: zinc metalloprotease HtpX [Candidatus Omnitrophica bacterium]|nr:zinc metalloprotease HtpX [Candidatus Omnitrophota bacterium]